jgi:GNAT superfamily N-acetyltransferase
VAGELAVRRASAADVDLVTAIISRAFAQDPLWGHAMARPDGGTAHHAVLWQPFIEGALRYPCTWLTRGAEATSIWIPPGGTEMTPEQEQRLADLAADYLGPAAGDYLELLSRFDAAHPRAEPHYYLTLLGTHPDHRGRGIGMRLLAHALEQVDAEHLPAYLESSNPANNRRYASVGFEPHGEFRYPGGGPAVTTMWRPASRDTRE